MSISHTSFLMPPCGCIPIGITVQELLEGRSSSWAMCKQGRVRHAVKAVWSDV